MKRRERRWRGGSTSLEARAATEPAPTACEAALPALAACSPAAALSGGSAAVAARRGEAAAIAALRGEVAVGRSGCARARDEGGASPLRVRPPRASSSSSWFTLRLGKAAREGRRGAAGEEGRGRRRGEGGGGAAHGEVGIAGGATHDSLEEAIGGDGNVCSGHPSARSGRALRFPGAWLRGALMTVWAGLPTTSGQTNRRPSYSPRAQ
ncbi:unnamed protein product [Miscanthus lutarioriparius]|uniref:Uncharacterized protein n=1 Tax=Miscanthus lutarioriparius TaxID=422564 RepID=A0A811QUW5_9POAL|nr:unnamed protein product [Miscanthus lutarioriparius]